MVAIDSFAYASKISGIDPKAKIFFAFVPLVLCIGFDDFFISVITIIVMTFMTVKYSAVSFFTFYKFMAVPLFFLVIGVLAVMVGRFQADAQLLAGFSIGSYKYGVSVETFYEGGRLAARALACLSCLYFFSFNTPMAHFFSMLERSPLPKVITSLMELIYRYIFILLDEALRINVAQHSRLGYGSFKSSLYCVSLLAGSLFIRSYDRALRAYAALESRCFEGSVGFHGTELSGGGYFYLVGAAFAVFLIIIGIFGKYNFMLNL